jgi:hypothetical protein
MSLGRKTRELNFPDELANRRGSILVRRSVDGAEPKDNSAKFRRRREQSTECPFEQPLQYALTLHYQVEVVAHGLLLIRPGQNSNNALFGGKLFRSIVRVRRRTTAKPESPTPAQAAYLNILETFSINSWGLKALESTVSAPITELMAERNPVRNSIRLTR